MNNNHSMYDFSRLPAMLSTEIVTDEKEMNGYAEQLTETQQYIFTNNGLKEAFEQTKLLMLNDKATLRAMLSAKVKATRSESKALTTDNFSSMRRPLFTNPITIEQYEAKPNDERRILELANRTKRSKVKDKVQRNINERDK